MSQELVDRIIATINRWGEIELHISWTEDGDNHYHLSGINVTRQGRAELLRVIEECLKIVD